MTATFRRLGGADALFTTVEHGLNGVTKVAIVVSAAWLGDARSFGFFAAVFTVTSIVTELFRLALAEGPLVRARSTGRAELARRWMSRGAIDGGAAAAGLAAVAVVVAMAAGVSLSASEGVAIAVGVGALVFADVRRYALVQSGRARWAVVSAAAWLAAGLALFAFLAAQPRPHDLATLLLAWLGPAMVGAALVVPPPGPLREVLSARVEGRGVGGTMAVESLLALVATALPIALSAAVVGPLAAGQLRLVQSVVAMPSLLVDVVRKRQTISLSGSGPAGHGRVAVAMLTVSSALAALILAGVVVWGRTVGATDDLDGDGGRIALSAAVALPLLVGFVARATGTAGFVNLRIRGRAIAVLGPRLAALVPSAVGLVVGYRHSSVVAIAWGIGAAAVTANVGGLLAARSLARGHDRRPLERRAAPAMEARS